MGRKQNQPARFCIPAIEPADRDACGDARLTGQAVVQAPSEDSASTSHRQPGAAAAQFSAEPVTLAQQMPVNNQQAPAKPSFRAMPDLRRRKKVPSRAAPSDGGASKATMSRGTSPSASHCESNPAGLSAAPQPADATSAQTAQYQVKRKFSNTLAAYTNQTR